MRETSNLINEQVCYIADDRIQINPVERHAVVDDKLVEFGAKSFDALYYLAKQADRVVPHSELLQHTYEYTAPVAKKAMESLLKIGVRGKLGPELGDYKKGAIRTMHGVGYYAVSSLTGVAKETSETDEDICVIADGRVEVRPQGLAVVVDGSHVDDITGTEYRLLRELARKPGKRLGSFQLLAQCQSKGSSNIDTPRKHISRLRAKLGPELGDSKSGVIRRDRNGNFYAVQSLDDEKR